MTILLPHQAYAAAYLDDIITIGSSRLYVKAILKSLICAGLTANPVKCAIGQVCMCIAKFLRMLQLRPAHNLRPKGR